MVNSDTEMGHALELEPVEESNMPKRQSWSFRLLGLGMKIRYFGSRLLQLGMSIYHVGSRLLNLECQSIMSVLYYPNLGC